MKKYYVLLSLFFSTCLLAQVGINTTTPNAQLDIRSSNQTTPSNTDGMLIPKVDSFPATNPTAAQQGMLVYLTTNVGSNQPGFYYWNNPTISWIPIKGTDTGTLDQAYDFGGAGAGRTITADTGAILINGTDGFVSTGISGSGALAPSGAGVKMVWNPRKAAFRAGNASIAGWEDINIGQNSVAFGSGTRALGNSSSAFGFSTLASGTSSTAFGSGVNASGDTSVAFGQSSSATGSYSFAGGFFSNASGSSSFAYGFLNNAIGQSSVSFGGTASGGNSTAFGLNSTASGTGSFVMGSSNSASSYGETVIGIGATTYTPSTNGDTQFRVANSTDRLFVIGNAIDVNNNSTVEVVERSDAMIVLKNGLTRLPSTTNAMINAADGKAVVTKEYLQTNTSGTLDQAYDFGGVGLGRTISADAGAVTIAGTDGLVSTGTFGSGILAPAGAGTRMVWNPRKAAFRAGAVVSSAWDDASIGEYSVAFGEGNAASGRSSTAFGAGNNATGSDASAFGFNTFASGTQSTAFGFGTTASGSQSTAFGNVTRAEGSFSSAFGFNSRARGMLSTAFGLDSFSESFSETVIGIGATAYTLSTNGATQFRAANATDRLFVIGNAIDSNINGLVDVIERRDAMIVLKNGLTRLPSMDNAMIDAADGKTVVTKEYLQSSTSGSLDQAYDFGGPGLGRTITADAGAVTINGTDGFVSTGTDGTGALVPSGIGTRMVWNPRKVAFRAGRAIGTEWDNASIGQYSVAFGYNSTASGTYSTAFGGFSTASGTFSTAFGNNALASGSGSIAIGQLATASGTESRCFGTSSLASGAVSTAFGASTIASGTISFVSGNGNSAPSYGETVIGIGATIYTPSVNGATQFRIANETDRLFVIGNAIDTNNNSILEDSERSNAMVVLKSGNTGIGITSPQERLQVGLGNIAVTQGDIYLGALNGVFNAGGGLMSAGINYIGDAFVAPTIVAGDEDLYIADDIEIGGQGYKPGGGTWVAPSDRRLKHNIKSYSDGLESLLRINPVTYQYNSIYKTLDTGETYVGVIAQELQEVAPYMINEKPFGQVVEEDENGQERIVKQGTPYLTFDSSALTYMLINAVKELNNEYEELKVKNEALENKLNALLSRIENLENK